jgi:hypothetical protein
LPDRHERDWAAQVNGSPKNQKGIHFENVLPASPLYLCMQHISDHDLERFHLGMVKDEAELAAIEEHPLGCSPCIDAAEEAAQYVDTIRVAIIAGTFDLE